MYAARDPLSPPVDPERDRVLGPPDAEMTLVEYGRYACPAATSCTTSSSSCGTDSATGGRRQHVGPGDVVVIPPHTPHGFVTLETPRIVYLVIRIDPEQVLEPQGRSR